MLACLVLGVLAIAAVGSLRASIERGLQLQGRTILGGDIEIEAGAEALPPALDTWLAARGARLSHIETLRSLLVATSGDRMLIDLKAVDGAYPLDGRVGLDPAIPLAEALATRDGKPGLVADPLVAARLGLHPGNTVKLGQADFTYRAALTSEPDHVGGAGLFGPRVIIDRMALAATGLIQPGSLVEHKLRATLPAPATALSALPAAFPGEGWRLRDAAHGLPGIERFIDETALFMTLVGLTALLVGGLGVGAGVSAWLEARARTIATLRCLGAAERTILRIYLLQLLVLAAGGVLAGAGLGAGLAAAIIAVFGDELPVPSTIGLYPVPLALAALFGLLTAASFALVPLARAARIPGAALFRDALMPAEASAGWRAILLTGAFAVLLAALVVLNAEDRRFAAGFCVAAALTLGVFRTGGLVLSRLAAWLSMARLSASWRLGLGNLHRPGTSAPRMLVATGLGLTTLAAVALIESNLRHELLGRIPADAPSFYFIDLQDDELARFEAIVHAAPGAGEVKMAPSLRARVVSIKGVPAAQAVVSPDTRWALAGDRGLTVSARPPAGTKLVAGAWWAPDYDGKPLMSFDAGLAHGWGVGVGDVITVNVLGRDIPLTIASLRDIDWRGFGINFAMVVSPGLLSHAPHGTIATVATDGDALHDAALLRAVTDALPNVTGIRVVELLQTVAALVGKLGAALAATGAFALAAGALVLAATIASGQARRRREAVILRTLGATRGQVRTAWLVEFGAVGLAAGLLAALIGSAASWAVMRFVMHAGWVFAPDVLLGTLGGCVALMLGFGYAGTARALSQRPAGLLRNE